MNLRSFLLATLLLLCVAAADCVAQGAGLVFSGSSVNFDTVFVDGTSCYTQFIGLRNTDPQHSFKDIRLRLADTTLTLFQIIEVSISPDSLGTRSSGIDTATVTIRWCPKTPGCLDSNATLLTVVGTRTDTTGQDSTAIVIFGCAVPVDQQNDSLVVSKYRLSQRSYLPSGCSSDTFSLYINGQQARNVRFAISGRDSAQFTLVSPSVLQSLRPGISTPVEVQYCPADSGPHQAVLTIVADSVGAVLPDTVQVDLSGEGITPWTLPTFIDMGMVDTGDCHDTTITISNLSSQLLILPRTNYDTTIRNNNFTIRFIGQRLDTSPSAIELTIQFCPHTADSLTVDLTFRDSVLSREFGWLRITGVGKAPADTVTPRSISLRLDTADVRVGDPIRLVLRAQPPLAPADINDLLRFHLVIPPRSLFFNGVESATPGWNVSSARTSDTSLEISVSSVRGSDAPTSTPFAILLTGLTTGSPINEVSLRLDSLTSVNVPITLVNGLVLLEGCELGTDPRMSRRVALQGLRLQEGSGTTLEVDYRAPLHARAYLRLADISGTNVQTVELPEGTDADASATVVLERIAPGLCVVELRAGDSRATTLMMIGP